MLKKSINKKVVILLLSLALLLAVLTGCGQKAGTGTEPVLSTDTQTQTQAPTNAELYAAAVRDATIADEDEIQPLVTLTTDDPLTTWENGKVLLCSYTRFADSYIPGQTTHVDWSDAFDAIWAFTDKEMVQFYQANKDSVTDWSERFTQVLGLPEWNVGKYTHVAAFWVDPADVLRPAYNQDITVGTGKTAFDVDADWQPVVDENYKKWFDGNIIFSYFDDDYPWTRLGYTYDWAPGEQEYGMTEFIVRGGADVDVEFTKTTAEFVQWLAEQGK